MFWLAGATTAAGTMAAGFAMVAVLRVWLVSSASEGRRCKCLLATFNLKKCAFSLKKDSFFLSLIKRRFFLR
jgi:hypothetical protein